MAPGLETPGERPQAPADSGMGSPGIDDLPPEILGPIFMLVHQELGKESLSALFMTCKHWNHLALSLPELWSSIEILVDDQEVVSQHLTTITTFLERSRNTPLSLTLGFQSLRPPIFENTSRFAESALRRLLGNFQRWRSVSFNFGDVKFFEFPPIPGQAVAPLLEHIDIKCRYRPPPSLQISCYTALVAAAPGLRSYSTHPDAEVPANMPWKQLQNFHCFSHIQPKEALRILDRVKNLQECHFMKLHAVTFRNVAPSEPLPRVTSAIRSMSVGGLDPHELQVFLSHLDTPDLNTLRVIQSYFRPQDDPALAMESSIIVPFLSSGSFTLSSLTIETLGTHENEFIRCLILTPSLTTLRIRKNGNIHIGLRAPEAITNKVLRSLTYDNSKPMPLCPILECLTLERCVDADDGVLSDMVQSRRWSSRTAVDGLSSGDVATLRCLDVVLTPNTHHEDQRRLNEFYQDGLRGVVKFGTP